MIATCTICHGMYDAGSEEQAYEAERFCPTCGDDLCECGHKRRNHSGWKDACFQVGMACSCIDFTEREWVSCADELPPRGQVVETKIHDTTGQRNVQTLKLHDSPRSKLWFVPDGSMYVYYAPTHWREVARP